MKTVNCFWILIAFSVQVFAADLSTGDVQQWNQSMTKLQPWLIEHEEKISQHFSNPEDPVTTFAESPAALKKAGLDKEFLTLLTQNGYDSIEDWSEKTRRITFAWMALEMEKQPEELKKAQAQWEAMENNPEIPEEQKVMMRQIMGPTLRLIEVAQQVPDKDKKVVSPYLSQLRTHFGQETPE